MTSRAYIDPESAIKLNGEVDAYAAFSMEGLLNDQYVLSAQVDLAAISPRTVPPHPYRYMWFCELQMQATPAQYTAIEFYAAPALHGHAARVWGDLGQSELTGQTDQTPLRNMLPFGSVIIENSNATKMASGGDFHYPYRYISLVGLNNGTGATINALDSNFVFLLQPYSYQGQDS